jgi:CPA1 family monovalent cation:H+ antiporter
MDQTPETIQVVSGIIVLLLIAALFRGIAKQLRLPFTVVLVLAGIGLSYLGGSHSQFLPAWHNLELSPSLILYVFLPSLIFESAFNLDARELRDNLGPVLMLAVPGLLVSTLAIGLIVWAAAGIPFTASLLLGAILSATDPVAVIAVFRRLGAPLRLRVLVEGESLFNDATSLVLARLILGVVVAGSVSERAVAGGALNFIVVFLGGLAVGWVLGLAAGYVLGRIEDNFIEITLTTVLAYLSFIVAEQVLHVSGVMATVAAGLSIGGWRRMKISVQVRAYLEHFWDYMALLANALIFLLVGLRVDLHALWETAGLLFWVIIAMLVSRAIVVYGQMPLLKRLPGSRPVSRAFQTVIYWGGLRGAVALAIVLSLPKFEQRERFIAVVTGAVLFTLVVNGSSIELLVRRLGLDRPILADRLARMEGDYAANRRALALLPKLLAGGLFPGAVAMRLQRQFEEKLHKVKAEIEDLHRAELSDDDQQRPLLYLRGLAEERYLYVRLFDQGQLGERAFRHLLSDLNKQIDALRDTGEYIELPAGRPRRRLEDALLRFLNRARRFGSLGERILMAGIALDYEMQSGHYQSSHRVLSILDELARLESTPWYIVDKMRRQYQQRYEMARRGLDQIAEQYPEFINDLQERFGQRLVLLAKAESIRRQAERGTLSTEVAEGLMHEINEELRDLKGYRPARLKLELVELVRGWAPLQGLPAGDLASIAMRMRLQPAREHEVVARQGEPGESMYFIAHGVVRLSKTDNGASRDTATFMAGDFFGEDAVLGGEPYNATATAVTPCSLYRLERLDLEVAIANSPTIREALAKPPESEAPLATEDGVESTQEAPKSSN